MDNTEKVQSLIQRLLAQEPALKEVFESKLIECCGESMKKRELFMTVVQAIRCYGQMDGVLSVIEQDGDVVSVFTHIASEVQSLNDRLDALKKNP